MPSTCLFTDISTKVKEWTFCQFQPNDLFWNNEMKCLGPSPCYWITVQRLNIKDTWFYWFNEGWRLVSEHPWWQRSKSCWRVPPPRHFSSICLGLQWCLFMGLAVRMTHSVPSRAARSSQMPAVVSVRVSRQGLWRTSSMALQDKELQGEVTGKHIFEKRRVEWNRMGKKGHFLLQKRLCAKTIIS